MKDYETVFLLIYLLKLKLYLVLNTLPVFVNNIKRSVNIFVRICYTVAK